MRSPRLVVISSALSFLFLAAAQAQSGQRFKAVQAESALKLRANDAATAQALLAGGAERIADYGSFQVFSASTAAAEELAGSGLDNVTFENVIELHAGAVDTRATTARQARSAVQSFSGKRLHLVQFAGPVKPEWYRSLEKTGVTIVDYIPHNAYLVYGDAAALQKVATLAATQPAVQFHGAFLNADKIHPTARATTSKRQPTRFSEGLYQIQMVADEAANADTLAVLDALKLAPFVRQNRSEKYFSVVVKLAPDALEGLSSQPDILSIWPYATPRKFDERQGMILAGQLTGNGPSGAGYLAWLASKGFTQSQFDTSALVVDVTDSGLDNGTTNVNHFALFRGGTTADVARVRYVRLEGTANSGSTLQGCDGHGNLNTHIIGGYVALTNFPHTDSAGYRYGLGIAPFVRVGSSVIFDPGSFTSPDYEDLASRAYRDGARISGNSWGADTAGGYDVDAQQYDAIVRDAQQTGSAVPVAGNQQMTFVFAAGNAGSGTQTVGSPGTAKNVITVGAAENVHSHATTNGGNSATGADGCDTPDSEANSANDVATFSSRGPCADSRKKPEIMAPGTHVTGGVGQNSKTMTGNGTSVTCFDGTGVCALPGGGTAGSTNNFFPLGQKWYSTSSGTSHSTPAVAGGAALVYQWFLNNFTNAASPAMIKAFLMNAARYMNGTSANDTLYSNNQGMGMMNLGTAFDGTPRLLRDQLTNDLFTASGQSRTFTGIVVSNSKPVRITLTWTDAPGATSGNAYKNNLDLTVVINGTTYRGNVFSGANSIAGGSADVRNNAESVFLPAGTTGSVAITIGATSINSDGVPNYGTALDQDFALVAYNISETQSPAIATAGSALIAESCGAGNSAVDPSENVTVALALRNVGTANTTNVVATLQTSGGVTSPGSAQNYGALTAGGAPVTNPFTFTASGVCGGSVTATLSLVDGATDLGRVSYVFQLGGTTAATSTRTNTAAITINDNAAATPYPSSISITGLAGTVSKVVVTLQGFSHAYPEDVDAILVGPGGQKVSLLGGAGGETAVSGLTLTFDDDASGQLGDPMTSGTWQPSGSVASMPGAAPAAPYATTLAEFIGSTPNGTWSLYVADAAASDTGSISTGWKIAVTAGQPLCCESNVPPALAALSNRTVVVGRDLTIAVSANDPVDGDPITLTASSLPPLATFGSTNGTGTLEWLNASPAGVYTTRFFAADKDGTNSASVVITCRTNEAPVLAAIGNKFVTLSNGLSFAVSATDPVGDDAISLTASSLPAGATFGATNGSGTFSWPIAEPTGTYSVTFYAADVAGTNTETIQITVAELPPFVTYTETFDTTANWGGGSAGSYNAKTYANNSTGPSGDVFSANSSVRETTFGVTSNAWRPGSDSTANVYVRYSLSNVVTRFAMQLARWDNSPTPKFDIRYSLDSGGSYTTLFTTNGDWFVSDKTYKTYDSGPINLTPAVGQQIYIELFRSTGERMLMDNFEVDYIPSGGAAPQTPPTLAAIGNKAVTVSNTLQFAVTATPTDGDTVTLTASNLPSGAVFGSTNEFGTFLWTNASPTNVYSVTFNAADNDGADNETITITVSDGALVETNCAVIISEYVEGSSNNKAIELFNPSASAINLASGSYVVQVYANGGISPTSINLTGTVAATSTYVVVNSSAGATLLAYAKQTSGSLTHNGNDAIVLRSGGASGTILDSIGVVGTDPGTEWGSGLTSTADNTLRRKGTVTKGDTNISDAFNPATEWDGYAVDTFTGLGAHTNACTGGGSAPLPGPGLAITTANQTVSFAVTNLSVGGTSSNLAGLISWTNALNGNVGTISAATSWLIPGVNLAVGTNVVTVSGTNSVGAASAAVTLIRESSDTDLDSIPDAWEQEYFGSLTNVNDLSDWDDDGFLDVNEFRAGSNPTNDQSLLKATSISVPATGNVIIWQSESNRSYILSRSTDLLGGFLGFASNIAATHPLNTYTDAASTNVLNFYRVELE
jgi:hypothetical protein